MSRRLRGQTTLQGILGKSTITKKPNTNQQGRKGRQKGGLQPSSSAPPNVKPKIPEKGSAQPLPAGFVLCPICSKPHKELEINAHVDACLMSQQAAKVPNQATLQQFTKSSTKTDSKRSKILKSSSCPDPPSQTSDDLNSPRDSIKGSPKRKFRSSTHRLSPSEQPDLLGSAAPVQHVHTPFEQSSQKEAFPEPATPANEPPQGTSDLQETPNVATDSLLATEPSSQEPHPDSEQQRLSMSNGGEMAATSPILQNLATPSNTGRGGEAEDSGTPERPGKVILVTQAVGRRYNSNGLVRIGQGGWLEREENNPKDRNALLVMCAPPGGVLGYLPRRIAQHLSDAVQQKLIGAEALVTQIPLKSTSPVDIHLEVWLIGDCTHELKERLQKAQDAADVHRSDVLERSSSGTGQILRANFLLLLDSVLEKDRHLLDANELGFIETYRSMNEQPQMLYLRLFLRAGPWFKLNSLSFSECSDIHATAIELEESGLAKNVERVEVSERKSLVACMKILEIQTVLAALDLQPKKEPKSRPPNKAQLVELLENALEDPSKGNEAFAAISKMTGPCIRLCSSSYEAIKRLQRLFFLNEGQGLSHFLVQDLGFLRYPSYKIERTQAVFETRDALLEYEGALRLAATVDEALEAENGEDLASAEIALAPALSAIEASKHKADNLPSRDFLLRFSAASVFTTMATIAVSIMEKQKRYAEACDLLRKLLATREYATEAKIKYSGGKCCPGRRGEWWCRLTLNLSTHLKRGEEALETAESALADEWVKHGDRLELQRRLLRLSQPPRRWKTYSWAQSAKREPKEVRIEAMPLPNVLGIKSKFPCDNEEGNCSVEQLALMWYAEPQNGDWKGMHAEGGIWSTLFGLLMWDVLFMSVPDIFRTSFQTAPLDLSSPSFYPARKMAIDDQLKLIREGKAPDMIHARWDSSNGTMCAGVNWGRYDAGQLAEIAECIGGPGLAAVCDLLAEDRSGWQGGMPDLLLWNPEKKMAKLSEVKGPRDTLSMQQRAWLNALSEAKLAVEVFKVVEPGTGLKRSKGRRW